MRRRWFSIAALGAALIATLSLSKADGQPALLVGPYAVFGWSEQGMQWTQDDYSEMCLMPLGNTLRAEVILRGVEPEILNSDVTVKYSVPNHSRSFDKTNFWKYSQQIFGVPIAPDLGRTGHGLAGSMTPSGDIWQVTGVPVAPINDAGRIDPLPVALITVTGGAGTATARPVLPASTEFGCALCHGSVGASAAHDILQYHDAFQGTHLVQDAPVLCASCHADPSIGAPGQPDVSTLSRAIHNGMANAVNKSGLDNVCYACHPGVRDESQRDVHLALGITCINCHGGMSDVADPARVPWTDEPRCSNCHNKPGFQYEQPGKLYKDSVGHSGVRCTSCHGSPHAIGPATTPLDNQQAISLQGHSGPINTCNVCHTVQPSEAFFHKVNN